MSGTTQKRNSSAIVAFSRFTIRIPVGRRCGCRTASGDMRPGLWKVSFGKEELCRALHVLHAPNQRKNHAPAAPMHHRLSDILSSRTMASIQDHMRSFPNGNEVKHIIMDMNRSFPDAAECFFRTRGSSSPAFMWSDFSRRSWAMSQIFPGYPPERTKDYGWFSSYRSQCRSARAH